WRCCCRATRSRRRTAPPAPGAWRRCCRTARPGAFHWRGCRSSRPARTSRAARRSGSTGFSPRGGRPCSAATGRRSTSWPSTSAAAWGRRCRAGRRWGRARSWSSTPPPGGSWPPSTTTSAPRTGPPSSRTLGHTATHCARLIALDIIASPGAPGSRASRLVGTRPAGGVEAPFHRDFGDPQPKPVEVAAAFDGPALLGVGALRLLLQEVEQRLPHLFETLLEALFQALFQALFEALPAEAVTVGRVIRPRLGLHHGLQ